MITLYRCSPPKKKTLWKCGGSCQTPQHLVDQSWCLCDCCCTLSCFYSRTGSSFTPHALTLSSRLLGPKNLIRAPVLEICAKRYCKKKKKREREREREKELPHGFYRRRQEKVSPGVVTRSAAPEVQVLRLKIKIHSLCEEEEEEMEKKSLGLMCELLVESISPDF